MAAGMPPSLMEMRTILFATIFVALFRCPNGSSAAELGDQKYLFEQAKKHWAFQSIKPSQAPAVPAGIRVNNPIDSFLRSRALQEGLQLAASALPRVLVRRLFFDLTGLPPTYEEIERWSKDWSAAKYRALVDHLLASKHYGEHWGRMWLDVARYADTKGYMAASVERRYPFAYTYRDWVVGALNQDVPYDRFLKQQLAADRMLGDGTTSTNDLAALGFLTVGSRFTGKTDLINDDRIDVITRGMLGLTVTCARCHDHMYDPIPTADYYSLYGVFMNTTEPKILPSLSRRDANSKAATGFTKEFSELQGAVDRFVKERHDELRSAETIAKYLTFVIESRGMERSKALSEAGKRDLHFRVYQRWQLGLKAAKRANLPQLVPWHAAADLYGDGKPAKAKAALTKLFNTSTNVNPIVQAALKKKLPDTLTEFCAVYAKTLAATDADHPHAEKPREDLRQVLRNPAGPTGFPVAKMAGYFNRGTRDKHRRLEAKVDKLIVTHAGSPPRAMVLEDVSKPRDSYVMKRGNARLRGAKVPRQFLAILAGPDRKPFASGSGRLELAQQIAAPDNPLTARVIVNRIWMHHFGKPLVSTPSDFGMQTPAPLQADLLDYLADYLIENGWSLKQLHRLIVQSATWQQGSTTPDLARDPENRFWARSERRRLSFEATRDALLAVSGELTRDIGGRPDALEGRTPTTRRAIYGFIDRYEVAPTLRTFDFADPNLHAPKRPETTVPQQALFFMNSPFVEARAKTLAAQANKAPPQERLRYLYRQVYGRDPSASELKMARAQEQLAMTELVQALLASNEFTFLD
jgi:hypothetical protein